MHLTAVLCRTCDVFFTNDATLVGFSNLRVEVVS